MTIRVLHLVEATTGGVARHVLDLARWMNAAGHEVVVGCPAVRQSAVRDVQFADRVAQAGIPLETLPMRRSISPAADWRSSRQLAALVKRRRPQVVHLHSSKAGALGRLALAMMGQRERPKVVYTANGFAFLLADGRVRRWFYLQVERLLGRWFTDALICVSPSELTLARSKRLARPERLALIENGVDLPAGGSNRDKVDLQPEWGRPLVGAVGRLAPDKGLEHLLQATARLIAGGAAVKLVLVGEGELENALRDQIDALGLDDRVILTGHREDVLQLLKGLDLFVQPSLHEGLPYSTLEAMAAGCAIVATDVPGNRDLIRHGESGLLVPAADPAALADAIRWLLGSSGERDRLGSAAAAAAKARPTAREMAEETVRLYEKLLGAVR